MSCFKSLHKVFIYTFCGHVILNWQHICILRIYMVLTLCDLRKWQWFQNPNLLQEFRYGSKGSNSCLTYLLVYRPSCWFIISWPCCRYLKKMSSFCVFPLCTIFIISHWLKRASFFFFSSPSDTPSWPPMLFLKDSLMARKWRRTFCWPFSWTLLSTVWAPPRSAMGKNMLN